MSEPPPGSIGMWNFRGGWLFYIYLFLIEGFTGFTVGFYQKSTRISHRFTHVPSHMNILPALCPSHPSRLFLSSGLSSLSHTANSH